MWNFPSYSVTRMSTIGYGVSTPSVICLTMPFSTLGMNWCGMAPPKILSTNSNPPPRGSGSTSIQQTAYWPCAARLLHVAALRLRRPLERLLVRDLRRVGDDVDAELALHPLDHRGDVRLAHAVEHRLVGLLRALDAQGRVVLADPGDRGRELVLVALGLRLDGDREQRLGQLDRRERRRGRPSTENVSPVVGVGELRHRADVAGRHLGHGLVLLALHGEQLADALLGASVALYERRVRAGTCPLNTRNRLMRPTKGSETVLNTSAVSGPCGSFERSLLGAVLGRHGDGRAGRAARGTRRR